MASYTENIDIIREGVYGRDIRKAIAEAISEAQGLEGIASFEERWEVVMRKVGDKMIAVDLEPLGDDDYKLGITGLETE